MNLLILLFLITKVYSEKVVLLIHPERFPKYVTGEKFFSVGLDTSVVADHFSHFNMRNTKLTNMVKELTPGYLRVGGNMADRLYFSENLTVPVPENITGFFIDYNECLNEEFDDCLQDFPNFTMSGQEWIDINNFAKKVKTKVLFDLNCLLRNKDGSWNSENAEKLISFSNKNKFQIDWQLGNEPNAFKHVFNYVVNATQLAKDFSKLRNILNKYPRYASSFIAGPDVTRPRPEHQESEKYLKEFLQGIESKDNLDAVAFHQYYLNGRTATVDDFLNPEIFDLLKDQIKIVNSIVKNTNLKDKPVWLTETSSAYGGGAKGLSNTFVGSFLWLDKLGLAAKYGIKTVVRQSVFQGYYALIDDDYNPTPDWWLSILYNKLVGPEVLECYTAGPETVRLYCHCAPFLLKQKPAITVFGINLSNNTAEIKIEGITWNYDDDYYAYILTPLNSKITATNVVINGKLVKLSESGKLPVIPKNYVNIRYPFKLPPYSLAFWILPELNANACSRPTVTLL